MESLVSNPNLVSETVRYQAAELFDMTDVSTATTSIPFKAPLPLSNRRDRQPLVPKAEEVEVKQEEEWSTLPQKGKRRPLNAMHPALRYGHDGYDEPSTPSQRIPAFRQPEQPTVRSKLTTFMPTPRQSSSGSQGTAQGTSRDQSDHGHGYRLSAVPNGTRDIKPVVHQVEPMIWSGREERYAAARDSQAQARQEAWVREVQRDAMKRGREEDWRDDWMATNRRQMDNNPHKRYAMDSGRVNRGDSTGRAFGF